MYDFSFPCDLRVVVLDEFLRVFHGHPPFPEHL